MGNEEDLVRLVIILYEGAKTRVRVDCELSEEFEVKVVMQQGSVLSPFLSALMVDVVIVFTIDGALSEFLYADDLILMNEAIKGLRNEFIKWKKAFDSKG